MNERIKDFPIGEFTAKICLITNEQAEEIYKEYSAKFGKDQSLQRIKERGGFGIDESIWLLCERIKRLEDDNKLLKVAYEKEKLNESKNT